MTAATNGEIQTLLATITHCRDDVAGVNAACNDGRMSVDHAVVHGTRRIVAVTATCNYLAAQLTC